MSDANDTVVRVNFGRQRVYHVVLTHSPSDHLHVAVNTPLDDARRGNLAALLRRSADLIDTTLHAPQP